VAANVCENFGLESKLADGLAIGTRLLRCGGRSKLDVLDAECIERLRDGDFGLCVEECVCELLALCVVD